MSSGQNTFNFMEYINGHMKKISDSTMLPAPIFLGGLATCFVLTFLGINESLITTLVSTVFPIFWSIKAIESPETDDDKQWLTYWVVISAFQILDEYSHFILAIIPFYYFVKLVFIVILMLPNIQGSAWFFNNVVYRLFKTYEKDINNLSENVANVATNLKDQGARFVQENKAAIVTGAMNAATQ